MKKRALISVSDKTNIVEFAKELIKLDYEIISTGGTLGKIAEAGLQVKAVEEVTGFPEILDGRVKTLHPYIHGGLLAKKDDAEHMDELESHNITSIDMVVVNLYPFKQTLDKDGVTDDEIIENIDIGGQRCYGQLLKTLRMSLLLSILLIMIVLFLSLKIMN